MNRQIAKLGAGLLVCYLVLFVQLNRLTVFGAERLKEQPGEQPGDPARLRRPAGQHRHRRRRGRGPVGRRARGLPVRTGPQLPRGRPVRPHRRLLLAQPRRHRRRGLVQRRARRPDPRPQLPRPQRPVRRTRPGRRRDPHPPGRRPAGREGAARRPAGLGGGPRPPDRRSARHVVVPVVRPERPRHPGLRGRQRGVHRTQRRRRASRCWPRPTASASSPGRRSRWSPPPPGSSRARSPSTRRPTRSTNEYTPPQTSRPLRNFGGSTCGGTLFEILRVSCNTAFAQMAVDLGPDAMVETAEAFGFNATPPIDLPGAGDQQLPHRLRPEPARPGPVGHRPERRVGHTAADGAGRGRRRQRRARS